LNTLGDGESREAWRAALIEYFRAVREELSEDSQERLEKNPLRILDSKDRKDKPFLADAPKIDEFLSDEARDFFAAVTEGLDAAGVAWVRADSLVRGLDYYRHTAFEFIPDEGSVSADALGSQSTVLGGGRYDGLMESLGGPATPAVGWAAGIERLAMLVGERQAPVLEAMVLLEHDAGLAVANALLAKLRAGGIVSDIIASGSVKKRYDKAMKQNPQHILRVNETGFYDISGDGDASHIDAAVNRETR
jgi:histidyl-tRNA synthetase